MKTITHYVLPCLSALILAVSLCFSMPAVAWASPYSRLYWYNLPYFYSTSMAIDVSYGTGPYTQNATSADTTLLSLWGDNFFDDNPSYLNLLSNNFSTVARSQVASSALAYVGTMGDGWLYSGEDDKYPYFDFGYACGFNYNTSTHTLTNNPWGSYASAYFIIPFSAEVGATHIYTQNIIGSGKFKQWAVLKNRTGNYTVSDPLSPNPYNFNLDLLDVVASGFTGGNDVGLDMDIDPTVPFYYFMLSNTDSTILNKNNQYKRSFLSGVDFTYGVLSFPTGAGSSDPVLPPNFGGGSGSLTPVTDPAGGEGGYNIDFSIDWGDSGGTVATFPAPPTYEYTMPEGTLWEEKVTLESGGANVIVNELWTKYMSWGIGALFLVPLVLQVICFFIFRK